MIPEGVTFTQKRAKYTFFYHRKELRNEKK